jgi:gliding motility-associated-like protein
MKRLNVLVGLFLSISFFSPKDMQAQCPNLNFTLANFNYWQAYRGSCSPSVAIYPSSATPGQHTIMDAEQLILTNQLQDENCIVIPKVPPGFRYSARLGNSSTGAEMEALEYTMRVDSLNSLLILHFAWAMEDPSHAVSEQPKFTMTIKDSLGRVMTDVPCGNVDFPAGQGLMNLACKTSEFVARNWTTVGFSLEPHMGKTIKIYFETRDCTLSGHYGYAYIVGECRPMAIDLMYCDGQGAARLRGPEGFIRYKWTRTKQPSWIMEGEGRQFQNIVVSDPIDGEEFICEVTSELGANCSAKLRTVIAKTSIDADFLYGVMDENGHVPIFDHDYDSWYDTCSRTATFVDMSSIRNSKKESILWEIHGLDVSSQDSLFTYTFPDPETNEPVEYLVRLTVYAENGCVDTSRGRIDQRITIYPSPRIEIEGDDQICEGDSTPLSAVALRSSFVNHEWTWEDSNKVMHQATGDTLMIYRPGTYFLTSLDSAGCYAHDSLVVTPLRPNMDITNLMHVDCYGEATGRFSHGNITGGQPPYEPFFWTLLDKDGNTYIDTGNTSGNTYMGLIAGRYIFEAIDKVGCALHGEVIIKQNDSLKIQGVEYPTTCGFDNGELELTATGGVPPYQFEIKKDDGTIVSSSNTASGLAVGDYVIQVTDYVNCVTSATISVTATLVPYIELLKNDKEKCEGENGSIRVTPKDAVPPVTFTWSTGREDDTTNAISSLKAGAYSVKMVDANGCESEMEIIVEPHPSPIITVSKTPETCGREDGTITLSVNSADPATLKYTWEGRSDTIPTLTGLKAGKYEVTVFDDVCSATETIEIEHVDGPVANFESNSYNVASNSVFTLTDVSQGTVNAWHWDMGDGAQTGKIVYYSYGQSGDYRIFLEVTDENGCTDTISKLIHIYEELDVYVPNMFTPNGDKKNDTWKPVMSEYSEEGYQLSVFDRWGQRIFHTTDPNEEWDGTLNGKYVASNSVYSYRIIVRDFTGQEYEFVGHVTVIR